MNFKHAKYAVGFGLIALALVYLGLTSFRSSLQYYVTVTELMARTDYYSSKILKVAGHARAVVREETPDGGVYKFFVDEGGHTLAVEYKGIIPDTFKDGAEVVVTGRLGDNNIFIATEILAKCASKYEAKMKPE